MDESEESLRIRRISGFQGRETAFESHLFCRGSIFVRIFSYFTPALSLSSKISVLRKDPNLSYLCAHSSLCKFVGDTSVVRKLSPSQFLDRDRVCCCVSSGYNFRLAGLLRIFRIREKGVSTMAMAMTGAAVVGGCAVKSPAAVLPQQTTMQSSLWGEKAPVGKAIAATRCKIACRSWIYYTPSLLLYVW